MSASKKLFTPDEVEILRSNPYTLSVTSKTIRFTLAFKQAFWTKRQAGERLQDIYSDLGYDVSILLSVKLDAPVLCRLDAPELDFACCASADCLHQHLQVI